MKDSSQTIVLFAGTSEGRRLALHCAAEGRQVIVCVATEYGEQVLPDDENIRVHCGRMDEQEMHDFLRQEQMQPGTEHVTVIDATHPYAVLVSQTLQKVCADCGIEYVRLMREPEMDAVNDTRVHLVDTITEAADLAEHMDGPIFLTTGSKELSAFVHGISDRARVYVRVLPSRESMELCEQAGVSGKQIICMQGPFSQELNQAMYVHIGARILVTKESGQPGGFADKLQAALAQGMDCIVIRRPKEQGSTYEQVCMKLGLGRPTDAHVSETSGSTEIEISGTSGISGTMKHMPANASDIRGELLLIGIGMGTRAQMTQEAIQALEYVPVIFGAKRMLEAVGVVRAKKVCEYRREQILEYLCDHPAVCRAAVVFSGDVGFYSGADGFARQFVCGERLWQTTRIAGLSSVNYFAARLGIAWQDVRLCSVHGRSNDLIGQIRRERQVFSLLNGKKQLWEIAKQLCDTGLSQVQLSIGCDLGYETERIWRGTLQEYIHIDQTQDAEKSASLCVALFENDAAQQFTTGNLADASYERGKVPLTKEEIRALALAKLRLTPNAVCYDIGAGTGGMTCDIARFLPQGRVVAFERGAEGCGLIRANAGQHGLGNIEVVQGAAPECLDGYGRPSHAFIGGSGGRLREIVSWLLARNPNIRIVIDAITLETVSEANELLKTLSVKDTDIICASIAKARTLGTYELMESMNPVYIFSFTGAADAEKPGTQES